LKTCLKTAFLLLSNDEKNLKKKLADLNFSGLHRKKSVDTSSVPLKLEGLNFGSRRILSQLEETQNVENF